MTRCPQQNFIDQVYHTADNSEAQESKRETSQAKRHDQSDSDEALYLPPLPPDQLDTVVKVTHCPPPPSHTHSLTFYNNNMWKCFVCLQAKYTILPLTVDW